MDFCVEKVGVFTPLFLTVEANRAKGICMGEDGVEGGLTSV